MDLNGTELINLTACETGLGQVTADGYAQHARTLVPAGARTPRSSKQFWIRFRLSHAVAKEENRATFCAAEILARDSLIIPKICYIKI